MVVDREREILAFTPKEYWTLDAHLAQAERRRRRRVQARGCAARPAAQLRESTARGGRARQQPQLRASRLTP